MDKYTKAKITFLGPRVQDLGGFQGNELQTNIQKVIKETIREHVKNNPKCVLLTGLGLGIETWAAQFALSEGMRYDVYVPFDNPCSKWPMAARRNYKKLLLQSRSIINLDTGGFSPQKLFKKDEQLIFDTDVLYTFYVNPPPLIKVAERRDIPIIDLLPEEEDDDDGWYIPV